MNGSKEIQAVHLTPEALARLREIRRELEQQDTRRKELDEEIFSILGLTLDASGTGNSRRRSLCLKQLKRLAV